MSEQKQAELVRHAFQIADPNVDKLSPPHSYFPRKKHAQRKHHGKMIEMTVMGGVNSLASTPRPTGCAKLKASSVMRESGDGMVDPHFYS